MKELTKMVFGVFETKNWYAWLELHKSWMLFMQDKKLYKIFSNEVFKHNPKDSKCN